MSKPQTDYGKPSLAWTLLDWRSLPGFGWLEACVLLGFCAVLALAIPFHEHWGDEAQAWLIARDNTLWQILRFRLHYEGAPGLWHIILYVFQRLHGGYAGFGWLGAAFAVAGVFVLLRWSPFPPLLRVLLPFTFFLQYQYAVVARSYVLFPVLAFTMCALFRSRRNPVWFGVVAGLLANVSVQGIIFSGTMLLLFLLDRMTPPSGSGLRRQRATLSQVAGPTTVYILLLAFALVVALPAPDQVYASGVPVVNPGRLHDRLMRFPGPSPTPKPKIVVTPRDPEDDPEPTPSEPNMLSSPLHWAAWYVHREEADISKHPNKKRPLKALLNLVLGGASEATWPISTSRLLACLFLLALGAWLYLHRYLRGLIPWVLLILFGERLWVADHHVGLLFIAILSAVWIAYQHPSVPRSARLLERSFVLLFALVCALQVTWSVVSIRADRQTNYDAGSQTAKYLMEHPGRHMVAFDFYTTAIQPYFTRSPFENVHTPYWIWSENDDPNRRYHSTIATHPDLVVFSYDRADVGSMRNEWAPLVIFIKPKDERDLRGNVIVTDLRKNGYRETHRFCGNRFTRLSSSYKACDVIFEPSFPWPASP